MVFNYTPCYKLLNFKTMTIKELKEETIKKWKESGLLDGLTEMEDIEKVKLFEPNLTQKVYVKTIPNEENNKNSKQK